MSNSEIEQSGTVKGHLPNEASLSGRISNGLSLSGHISIGGAGDFIIKMTVTSDGDYNYTVTSCDATVEQIDAAVADGKRVVVIASIDGSILELPMLQGVEGNTYYFGAFSGSQIVTSFVEKIGNTSNWEFDMNQIQSEDVGYSNAALPSGTTNVKMALDELVPKSHSHTNKAILDKFAETNGKPTYDGKALGGGASTAEDISYTLSEDVQNEFPELAELESNTVKSGLDLAMYYAFAGMYAQYIVCDAPSTTGLVRAGLQFLLDNFLFPAMLKAHEHDNKSVLDKLSVSNGKLQYNGSDVGLKGDTPVKGTDYWTAADKAEIVNDTLAALPKWTGGSY